MAVDHSHGPKSGAVQKKREKERWLTSFTRALVRLAYSLPVLHGNRKGISMDEHVRQEALTLIKVAKARRSLLKQIKKADLKDDPNWKVFTRGMAWFCQRKRG
jgi:hypothetical protein